MIRRWLLQSRVVTLEKSTHLPLLHISQIESGWERIRVAIRLEKNMKRRLIRGFFTLVLTA